MVVYLMILIINVDSTIKPLKIAEAERCPKRVCSAF